MEVGTCLVGRWCRCPRGRVDGSLAGPGPHRRSRPRLHNTTNRLMYTYNIIGRSSIQHHCWLMSPKPFQNRHKGSALLLYLQHYIHALFSIVANTFNKEGRMNIFYHLVFSLRIKGENRVNYRLNKQQWL